MNTTTKMTRKETRKLVYDKLYTALEEFKPGVKEKRFLSNLKKASKMIAGDLPKNKPEKNGKAVKVKAKKLKPVSPEKAAETAAS